MLKQLSTILNTNRTTNKQYTKLVKEVGKFGRMKKIQIPTPETVDSSLPRQEKFNQHLNNLKSSLTVGNKTIFQNTLSFVGKDFDNENLRRFIQYSINSVSNNKTIQRASKLEFMELLFENVKKLNLENSTQVYNSVMKFFIQNQELKKVSEIFDFLNEPTTKSKPDVESFEVVIEADHLFYSHRTKTNLDLMLKLGLKPTTKLFYYIIKGCRNQRDMKSASEYFERMENLKLKPTADIFETLVYGYLTIDINVSISYLDKMFTEYSMQPKSKVLGFVLGRFFEKPIRSPEGAMKFWNRIETVYKTPIDKHLLDIFMMNLRDIEDVENISKLFNEMESKYGVPPNIRSFELVITAYCSVKNAEKAVHYFNLMQEHELKPTYTINRQIALVLENSENQDNYPFLSNMMELRRIQKESWLATKDDVDYSGLSDQLSSLKKKLQREKNDTIEIKIEK